MLTAFSTALSALNAASTAIDVVGNNLANLNTPGFKASEVLFHDLVSEWLGAASGNSQVGLGVGQVNTERLNIQGGIQTTNGPLDSAIEGNGFFVVRDPNGQMLYTRAGNFQMDTNGNLVTATGEKVQGWNAVNGTVNSNSVTSDITVPLAGVIPAIATTSMSMNVNLNSAAVVGDPSATFSAPIQVVDSEGASHTLTATFTKTDVGKWSYAVTIPATDLKGGGSTPLASGTLSFDGNGNLTSPAATDGPAAVKITGLADGASDMTVNWNLYNSAGTSTITQLAQASGVSGTAQNGAAAGQITSVNIQNGGLIIASYSNGQKSTVAQLALASILNPNSLVNVGNNNLQTSADTAQPAIGAANSGGRGQIDGGAIESSSADMAKEFTSLLTFERGYQAASRVITTSDQLLQETVNLIHP